jgi:GNAT superfamily N-acetyltransferase
MQDGERKETADVEVRRAAADDAVDAARLLHDFNAEFGDPTPSVEVLAARLRPLLDRDDFVALLAGGGPDAVAVLRLRPSFWLEGRDAYLEELYVVPALRGRGIGRALLEAVLEAARQAGAARIELGTGTGDTAARALYESCGFTNRDSDGGMLLFYERDL